MWLVYIKCRFKPVLLDNLNFIEVGMPILVDGKIGLIQRIVNVNEANRIL